MFSRIHKHTLFLKRDKEFYLVWVGKRKTWEIAYFNSTDDLLSLDLLDGQKGAIMRHVLEYTDNSDKIFLADTEDDVNTIIGVKAWAL